MKQIWLALQSAEFQRGYDAACALLPRNKTQSAEWLRGYDQAQNDIDYHDYA